MIQRTVGSTAGALSTEALMLPLLRETIRGRGQIGRLSCCRPPAWQRSYFVTLPRFCVTCFGLRTAALGTRRVLQELDLNNRLETDCFS